MSILSVVFFKCQPSGDWQGDTETASPLHWIAVFDLVMMGFDNGFHQDQPEPGALSHFCAAAAIEKLEAGNAHRFRANVFLSELTVISVQYCRVVATALRNSIPAVLCTSRLLRRPPIGGRRDQGSISRFILRFFPVKQMIEQIVKSHVVHN